MKALILGAFGQDGYFLSRHLRKAGWTVLATGRNVPRVHDLPSDCLVSTLNVTDSTAFARIVDDWQPEIVFNLAAVSSVAASWQRPMETIETNGTAVYGLLEVLRHQQDSYGRTVRFVQCTSSEAFGGSSAKYVTPDTSPRGVSPYGLSKAIAHEAVRIHRRAHGTFASNAVMYNHESPRRPMNYLSRRISSGVAKIRLGLAEHLTVHSLNVIRDWGHADDYCRALVAMGEVPEPSDFILATGEQTPLPELLEEAFASVDLHAWADYVKIEEHEGDRPVEPVAPPADVSDTWSQLRLPAPRRAREVFREMVAHDLKVFGTEL
jgi:GDPmannose 4,6-dehydratase